MSTDNKHPVELATQHAHILANNVHNIAGVTLGGSFSKNESVDNLSDIDIFVYVNSDTLPPIQVLASQLNIKPDRIRRRTYLLEYRLYLDDYDTNIKFFTLKYFKDNIYAFPSLDPQYLEEIESYNHQTILIDRSSMRSLLSEAQTCISKHALWLTSHAIERYGKGVSWAIFQWKKRGYATVALHSLFSAFDCLICAYYLGEGRFPPSLKWRTSERSLKQLKRGAESFEIISNWLQQSENLNISYSLNALRNLENIVSQNFTLHPWDLFKEKWWWLGVENTR